MTTPAQLLIQQLTQREDERRAVQMLWMTIDVEVPTPKQFDIWLNQYPFEVVVKAIKRTGNKLATLGGMSHSDMIRYASGVMRDTIKRAEVSRG